MKPLLRTFIVLLIGGLLTSCLSTEVELDLTNADEIVLDLTYRMPLSLWQFGVFDEESPERTIPVSRRDAEETATRLEGVTLERYTLEESDEAAVIRAVYTADSVEALRGLWGRVAGKELALSFEDGTLELPISDAIPQDEIDPQQRAVIEEVFTGHTFAVSVITPGAIVDASYPNVPEETVETTDSPSNLRWTAPMASIFSTSEVRSITIGWETR